MGKGKGVGMDVKSCSQAPVGPFWCLIYKGFNLPLMILLMDLTDPPLIFKICIILCFIYKKKVQPLAIFPSKLGHIALA